MKKIIALCISILLILTALPITSVYADDITGIALENEMRDLINRGVIQGYGNGVYAPSKSVNRGEFATFLARALHLPNGKPQFSDVSASSSLAQGIFAVASAGIVNGYSSSKFAPNDLITREQMAIMIDKSLDYLKINKVAGSLNFLDEKTILSATSRKAVSHMVGMKIISGFPSPDGKGTLFKPKNKVTRAEAAAFISRMLNLGGVSLPATYDYRIGTVNADGTIKLNSGSYKTFNEATKAITDTVNQVILKNNKVVKMRYGIVVSRPTSGATTRIYEADLKTNYAPVSPENEIEYVTSDENKVTVKVAGRVGYVKHEDVVLIPSKALKGRSYYSVNSAGDLVHNLYDHSTNKYIVYVYGKAPSNFKTGVKYLSWDGATFTTENGTQVGKYYQYYNVLPVRTTTNYTATELNNYIMKRLTEKENLYKNNPTAYARYKDATKKSKIIGLGTIAKDFEKSSGINALVIVGMGIHESDFGMSMHAQQMNNIFGIKVYDSNPQDGEKYASIRDCVASLANNYLNKNYIPPSGLYANGGITGNKSRGINVRYASDPYWGQKIAGHIYQLDKTLGGKDFLNNASPYQVHETTTDGLNVRSTAEVNDSNKLYTYKRAGFPVAVVGTTSDGKWHKILSDLKPNQQAYISTSYTKLLPVAK